MRMLKVKRAYERKEASDGKRILVDRLWPRGLRAEDAAVDEWRKDLSPSEDLRKWFNHEPEKWEEFRRRYKEELSSHEKKQLLERIADEAANSDVTIVYGARETRYNNARVLEELIGQLIKSKSLRRMGARSFLFL